MLWPTWRTAPIWRPSWSQMAYSLLISMTLAFWLTTRIGSVNKVPPPRWVGVTPAAATSPTTFSVARWVVGTLVVPTGGSTAWRPWEATCSVQRAPSHQRLSWRPNGSGYQAGGCCPPGPAGAWGLPYDMEFDANGVVDPRCSRGSARGGPAGPDRRPGSPCGRASRGSLAAPGPPPPGLRPRWPGCGPP